MIDQEESLLNRVWTAWTRFWFTPADPTPLCLMRIVAGLLTIYVHVAYTFDLVGFFGPNGWYDQATANRFRHEIPHFRGRTDWVAPIEFNMPQDEVDRAALREFLNRVSASSEVDSVMLFLNSIESYGEQRNELLRYVVRPVDEGEFQAEIKAFVDDQLQADQKESLPRFFALQTTPESRKNFAESILRFRRHLPVEYAARKRLVNLLIETSPDDWAALSRFVSDLLKIEGASQRAAYLDRYTYWSVSPKYAYGSGMPTFSPWFHTKDLRMLWLIHGLFLIAMVAFTLGYQTRVFAVITWLGGLSYINRAQPYLFGQDTMMNLCLIYLMLSPCGAKWSLDRWIERKRAEAAGLKLPHIQPSVSAGFILRIFQIQYCLMYFSAGLSKLKGDAWWNGSAMHYCMVNAEFSPMHVKVYRDFVTWLCSHRVIWELVGTGTSVFTLLLEMALPYLVWTRMRPIMVAGALLLHTGIAILMGLSVFSLFMFVLLLCFVPPDAINWMFGSDED